MKRMVENNSCHLFTFPLALVLASNGRSIDDTNSFLLAFFNKMYFAVTWIESRMNVSYGCKTPAAVDSFSEQQWTKLLFQGIHVPSPHWWKHFDCQNGLRMDDRISECLHASDGLEEKLRAMIQHFLFFCYWRAGWYPYWMFCVLFDQYILAARVSWSPCDNVTN